MLFNIVITKMKLKDRNNRCNIIVNFISKSPDLHLHINQYPYVSKQFESITIN